MGQTDLGRGRVALRLALNEGALVDYLRALLFNQELTVKYYHEYALMRSEEHVSICLMLLEVGEWGERAWRVWPNGEGVCGTSACR